MVGHNDIGLAHGWGDICCIAVFSEYPAVILAGEEVSNFVQGFSLSHLYTTDNGTISIRDAAITTPSVKIYNSIAHIIQKCS